MDHYPGPFEMVVSDDNGSVILHVTSDRITVHHGMIGYEVKYNPSKTCNASQVFTGAKVKIMCKHTGKVLLEVENASISQMAGDVSAIGPAKGCVHDIKIYDSGFTRERYCTKCTWKEKI
jgi:hypothetical protein